MRLTVIIVFLSFLGMNTYAQERFFSFIDGFRNTSILETDTGYLSVGLNGVPFEGNSIQFVILNLIGDIVGSVNYEVDSVYSTEYTRTTDVLFEESSILIAGTTVSNSNYFRGQVWEFATNLTVSNLLTIERSNGNWLKTLLPLSDSVIVAGQFIFDGVSQPYGSYIAISNTGAVFWEVDFFCGADCRLEPFHILPLSDGGYIFTLKEEHLCPTLAIEDIRSTVIRTDSEGNQLWRIWPGTDRGTYRNGPWTVQTSDGNLLFAYTDVFSAECLPQFTDTATVRFVKIDLGTGETIWEKDLMDELPNGNTDPQGWGQNYQLTQMETVDGGFILVGTRGIEGLSIKVTEDAEYVWHRFYHPPGITWEEHGADVKMEILGMSATSDGGFIMAGEYLADPGTFFPNGIQSAFALKVDEYGCLEPDCQLADTLGTSIAEAELPEINMYPNPVGEVLYIEVVDINHQISDIRIIDMLGRESSSNSPPFINGEYPQGEGVRINVSYLQNGIYILSIQFEDGRSASRKFVKQ
jgi:hypothetical protein